MLDLKHWNQPTVRGCLGNLMLYAIVAAAVGAARVAASTKRIDVGDMVFMSLVAAAPLSLGLLYWWGIAWSSGDGELIRAALRGVRCDDGRRVAVVGSIEPLGEVLHAPFSGRECVAYWYQVVAPRVTRLRSRPLFSSQRWAGSRSWKVARHRPDAGPAQGCAANPGVERHELSAAWRGLHRYRAVARRDRHPLGPQRGARHAQGVPSRRSREMAIDSRRMHA